MRVIAPVKLVFFKSSVTNKMAQLTRIHTHVMKDTISMKGQILLDEDFRILHQNILAVQAKTLEFRDCIIDETYFSSLARNLINYQITNLILFQVNLTLENVRELALGIQGSSLRCLELTSNNIGLDGCRHIFSALANSNIQRFQMRQCHLCQ